ncbi:hypothetical protein [Bremerella sp. P1]|uniref:hypothetical protein n=1 Tax=Bremerella sp. P1 TaxID=3026424 RepID=UPI002368B630|nr:hypothetical protein [Bremerella sp. P1]WDI42165.1 hypothetical protein PSR63_27315 [Bremerella sp. P1]
MSHHHAAQPETHGAGSPGHAPQVAVRDGNRLLCPCCGEVLLVLQETPAKPPAKKPTRPRTMLEEPIRRQQAQAEARLQDAIQRRLSSPESRLPGDSPIGLLAQGMVVPIDPKVAQYEFPDQAPPKQKRPSQASAAERRRKRPSLLRKLVRLAKPRRSNGRIAEPLTYVSARLHAWLFYRLKRLNLQLLEEVAAKQEVVAALSHTVDLLDEGPSQEEPSQGNTPRKIVSVCKTQKVITPRRRERVRQAIQRHAPADLATAPDDVRADKVVTTGTIQEAMETSQRGPPWKSCPLSPSGRGDKSADAR